MLSGSPYIKPNILFLFAPPPPPPAAEGGRGGHYCRIIPCTQRTGKSTFLPVFTFLSIKYIFTLLKPIYIYTITVLLGLHVANSLKSHLKTIFRALLAKNFWNFKPNFYIFHDFYYYSILLSTASFLFLNLFIKKNKWINYVLMLCY